MTTSPVVPDPKAGKTPAMAMLTIAIACIGTVMLSGCTTLEKGATDQVYVISDPAGADVTVSYAEDTCRTPCGLDVPRGQAFTVAIEKAGYESQQIQVTTKSTASAAATSHDLTAGYLGRVIDNRTDADIVHVPNPVVVKLKKTP